MRTTIDIPEAMYRELKVRAATDGTTIREIILDGLSQQLNGSAPRSAPARRTPLPVIRSANPGSLRLGDEGVYEYIPFP
jgi:hypothetical protein